MRPPRARIARRRPRASGAVISEPLDASGFAPRQSRKSVRSRSGIAIVVPVPNISADAACLGYWSTVEALKMFLVPKAFNKTFPYSRNASECAAGLPM